MTRLTLMRWLLANLIAVGLTLAPLSVPMSSAAMTHGTMAHETMAHETIVHGVMSDMMDMSDMSATSMPDMSVLSDTTSHMAVDMPCCPDTQKGHDCQDCPFVAICMLKISPAQPASANGLPMLSARHELFIASDDVIAEGMNRPPPDQPPRILA